MQIDNFCDHQRKDQHEVDDVGHAVNQGDPKQVVGHAGVKHGQEQPWNCTEQRAKVRYGVRGAGKHPKQNRVRNSQPQAAQRHHRGYQRSLDNSSRHVAAHLVENARHQAVNCFKITVGYEFEQGSPDLVRVFEQNESEKRHQNKSHHHMRSQVGHDGPEFFSGLLAPDDKLLRQVGIFEHGIRSKGALLLRLEAVSDVGGVARAAPLKGVDFLRDARRDGGDGNRDAQSRY